MADRAQVESEVRRILASMIPGTPDPQSLRADVPIFRAGLGLDSLSGLALLAAIEEHFHVYIDDDNFDVFDSLEKLVDFVARQSQG